MLLPGQLDSSSEMEGDLAPVGGVSGQVGDTNPSKSCFQKPFT